MHNVTTDNGSVNVFVNEGEVVVEFVSPYVVDSVAYEGVMYVRKDHTGVWRLWESFIDRVDDWEKEPTYAAWKVMLAMAQNLAEDFYTPENLKQFRRESLETKIKLAEREIARLENDLAQLKNDLRSL